MSDRRSRFRGCASFVLICLVIELLILMWPEAKTADDGWTRRGWSGEIAGETTLVERFYVMFPDLRAITFYARPSGNEATGTAHLKLVEIRKNDTRVVDERDVPAADLVSHDHYEYRFKPLPYSTGLSYLFTIELPDVPAGRGIVVEIMRRSYGENPRNVLSFGGQEHFGSLRFTADVDRRTLLARAVTYFQNGALGGATIVAVAIAWVALHLLGARAVMVVGALCG